MGIRPWFRVASFNKNRTVKRMNRTNGEIQTSRQYNLDLLRALAIIGMIICHPVIQLGIHHPGYEQNICYLIGDYFFGDYLAVAHAFMFAMGAVIPYSKKNRPADLIRRGLHLYLLGFILNFFRYGIYALLDGLLEGAFAAQTVYALTVQDILHFAGLALIATGVFRQLKLKTAQIFLISVILSALGGHLAFAYQGSDAANYLIGHFITTTEECSCFAFFNWYFFVASGLVFGTMICGAENLNRFYGRLLCVSGPITMLYIALTTVYGPLFMTKNGWYYALSLPEAAGLLSIDLTLVSAFHFLLNRVDASHFSALISMSRNVNRIYCIHWCILGFIDSIFCYLMGIVFPWPVIYLIGIALIVVSAWIAARWERQQRTKKR